MRIPDHYICLLRNLYVDQEATLRTRHGTTDWFKIWKGGSKLGKKVQNWKRIYIKALYCHHAYLTYMQSTSCKMLGWMKHKLESRLPGEISITSDMQMIPPLWRKQKESKETLDKSERGV